MRKHLHRFYLAGIAMALMPMIVNSQQYTAVDLGTLGGTFSTSHGINASGQVVGAANIVGDVGVHAFVTNPLTNLVTDLGTLGGVDSYAWEINDSGYIVGRSQKSVDSNFYPFVAYPSGGMLPLNTGTDGGTAIDINQEGLIVGFIYPQGSVSPRAFMSDYSSRNIVDLGYFGGVASAAQAVNAKGDIVGFLMYESGLTASFVTNGHSLSTSILAPVGHDFVRAIGINASGQVTGMAKAVGLPRQWAFLYDPADSSFNRIEASGTPISFGNAINASGEVVGATTKNGFLYRNGTAVDINSLLSAEQQALYSITGASDINDRGQIAAKGLVISSGETHAFLLNPATYVPAIQYIAQGTKGLNDWYVSQISLSWIVTGSPAPTTSGCEARIVTGETKGRTFTCAATNSVGMASQSVTIKVDKTLPLVLLASPAATRTYKRGQSVFARYSCSDLLSGLASCVGSVANGARVSTTTPGTYSFDVTATDRAGNTSTKTVTYQVR